MILLAGIGVGGDGRFLAPVNAAQVGFGDIGAQPDVIEIGERDHGRAGSNYFSEFGLAHRDDAGRGCAQRGVIQVDTRQTQIRAGFVEIGAGDGDVFFAAAFDGLVVALLRSLERGFGALQCGCGQVAVLG